MKENQDGEGLFRNEEESHVISYQLIRSNMYPIVEIKHGL